MNPRRINTVKRVNVAGKLMTAHAIDWLRIDSVEIDRAESSWDFNIN